MKAPFMRTGGVWLHLGRRLLMGIWAGIAAVQPVSGEQSGRYEARPQANIEVPPEMRQLQQLREAELAAKRQPMLEAEQKLWWLLGQQRFAEARRLLGQYRRVFAGHWQPPLAMVAILERAAVADRIARAVAMQDDVTLMALARRHPDWFDCGHISFWWGLAAALQRTGDGTAAREHYRRMLNTCRFDRNWLATVYKAREVLHEEAFGQLLQDAARWPAAARRSLAVAEIIEQFHLQRFLTALPRDPAAAVQALDRVAGTLVEHRHADRARLIGWAFFRAEQWQAAWTWFERAHRWGPSEHSAYALALLLQKRQRYDEALRLAEQPRWESARMTALRHELYIARAVAAYRQGELERVLTWFTRAEALAPLPRDVARLRGWVWFHTKRYSQAAGQFIRLYRKTRSADDARGVFYSYQALGHDRELAGLARSLGGPLYALWRDDEAQRLYGEKRFVAAQRLGASRFPLLRHIDTPSWAVGAAHSARSGDAGLSRLAMTRAPVFSFSHVVAGRYEVGVEVAKVDLAAGTLSPGRAVGGFPAAGGDYLRDPETAVTGSEEWWLRVRQDGRIRAEMAVGRSADGGGLDSDWMVRLGADGPAGKARWRFAVTSLPVRESLLSYVGFQDPFGGDYWGRVKRSQLTLGWDRPLRGPWRVGAVLQTGRLTGTGVADNRFAAVNLHLHHEWQRPGLDALRLGAYVESLRYRRNLGGFTLGHGGYFSPQALQAAGLELSMLTAEGRQRQFALRMQWGYQDHHEDAAPLFPLDDDGRRYAGQDESGPLARLEATGLWRLGRHWSWGGSVAVQATPRFQGYSAMIFVRRWLRSRPALFSTDLPERWP